MENASKALIIAGAVLIGIVIISMGILFAANLRKTAKTYYTSMDTSEAQKFNSEITKDFITENGKTYITAQGIRTLKNLLETPKYKGLVEVERTTTINDLWNKENNNSLRDYGTRLDGTKIKKYKIEIEYSNQGLIETITITE